LSGKGKGIGRWNAETGGLINYGNSTRLTAVNAKITSNEFIMASGQAGLAKDDAQVRIKKTAIE
jgi:hypothetical protein